MKQIDVMMIKVMIKLMVMMKSIYDQIKIVAFCFNCDVQIPNKRFSIILDDNHIEYPYIKLWLSQILNDLIVPIHYNASCKTIHQFTFQALISDSIFCHKFCFIVAIQNRKSFAYNISLNLNWQRSTFSTDRVPVPMVSHRCHIIDIILKRRLRNSRWWL